jgi:hypothetical protein
MESGQSCRKRDERFTRVNRASVNHAITSTRAPTSQARLQGDSFAEHGQGAPRQSDCVRF